MRKSPNKKRSVGRTQSAHSKDVAVMPYVKKSWVVVTAIVGVLFTALLNAPTLLDNARKLPASYQQTKAQYLTWLHEDSDWTGNWSSFPEGLIDVEEMRLSDVDMQITIWASQGNIDGVIGTRAICKQFPFWDYVLLRGNVSGDSAEVVAFDYIGGLSRDFAQLQLERNGNVLTITPVSGQKDWFPATARLGRHPRAPDAKPDPDMDFCDEELKSFIQELTPAQTAQTRK